MLVFRPLLKEMSEIHAESKYDSSPPTPNRRAVCHLCDESNAANTCCDATIPRDKIKRVGRHYMDISVVNDTASQHSTTNERTCRVAVYTIVLKQFSTQTKLRKVG